MLNLESAIKKINQFTPKQREEVIKFIEFIEFTNKQKETQEIINKWEYLTANNQELDPLNPLSNEEIDFICDHLKQQNKPRPTIETKTKINVPDNFNEPLPDEILNSFYQ